MADYKNNQRLVEEVDRILKTSQGLLELLSPEKRESPDKPKAGNHNSHYN